MIFSLLNVEIRYHRHRPCEFRMERRKNDGLVDQAKFRGSLKSKQQQNQMGTALKAKNLID